MSFNVTFYNFNKHYNSTKRPGASDSEKKVYSCNILRGSSIYNPKIELDIGLTSTPARHNYCVIPAFDSRYYFVKEWTFSDGLWIANLQEDVLASWKTTIGHTSRYILRAANEFDGNVIDDFYPCKTNCTYHTDTLNIPYTTGCYILGIVSKLGAYGSIAYYVMDSSNMSRFVQGLMSDIVGEGNNPLNGFSLNDASLALQTSLIDPVQYVKSVMWCPFNMTDLTYTAATQLDIFKWTLSNVSCGMIYGKTLSKTYEFTLTKHPDTQSRGNYVNTKPYTNITLNFPPFGNIEIDTSVTNNASKLNIELDYDIFTGSGQLRVICNGIVLNQINTQLGVPVQISQVTRDYLGAAQSVVSGVGSVVSGALTGGAGLAGGIAGGVNAIGDAVRAMIPRSNTIGSNGNYSVLNYQPRLDYQFFRPVADDLTNKGRPLCQFRAPENIGGFMIIQDGSIEGATTFMEGEEIRRLLETGFYFE
ncbi:MAG: hypothetical protein IIY21_14595 [Clostridiales bacterium]|nr:hypothetical protein [Clostridiales bacterium]